MKNILFVIPSLKTGGTNSALDALYSKLNNEYKIHVFSILHQPRDHNYLFDDVILKQDELLSLFFADYSKLGGAKKILAFFIKSMQSLLRVFGVNIGFIYARRVVKRLEKGDNYDYIVGYQEGYTTIFTSLFRNKNKIAWIHCNYDTYLPFGKSELNIYIKYKNIVCVSNYTASIFVHRYPSLKSITIPIHNLVDETRVRALAKEPIDDIKFVKDGFSILSVGRFSSVKRFSEIPQIAMKLKERGLSFTWYILGPHDDESEVDLFEKNLKKYSASSFVKWLGGKSNPYPYFKTADLYVCLSESEACPMVFKEAKLLDLPIVTTDFPSSYEFVHDDNGIITPFDNICDAIETIYSRIHYGDNTTSSDDDNQIVLTQLTQLFE